MFLHLRPKPFFVITFDFTNSAKGTSRTSAAVTTALPTSVAMSNITALQNVFYLTLY